MRSLSTLGLHLAIHAGILLVASANSAAAQFIQIDLSGAYNAGQPTPGAGTFPTGAQTLGGVPFDLSTGSKYMWYAGAATGPNPRVLELAVDLDGVKDVYILMNTAWGKAQAGLILVEFTGSGGAQASFDLVGGTHIRDFNNWIYTNTITNPDTVNVFSNSQGQRLDMLRFALGPSFEGQTLTSIRVSDFGDTGLSRVLVCGITAAADLSACYPDCDGSSTLNIDDFICFQTLFAIQDPAADCDQDGFLNIDDFICFQTLFAIGC